MYKFVFNYLFMLCKVNNCTKDMPEIRAPTV